LFQPRQAGAQALIEPLSFVVKRLEPGLTPGDKCPFLALPAPSIKHRFVVLNQPFIASNLKAALASFCSSGPLSGNDRHLRIAVVRRLGFEPPQSTGATVGLRSYVRFGEAARPG
jgi:hypothetical protein